MSTRAQSRLNSRYSGESRNPGPNPTNHPASNPVTDQLDLWTSALLTKSTTGRGSNGKIEAYGIKKLRELILELAVRGKLVPQDSSDEPASELVNKIGKEISQSRKVRKTKKQNTRADISKDVVPFDLPVGWQWVKLGELAEVIRGVTYKKHEAKEDFDDKSIALLRANNIGYALNLNNLLYVPSEIVKREQLLQEGDLLIAMSSGSVDLVGKAARFDSDVHATFGAFCGVVRSTCRELWDYLSFFLKTPLYRAQASGAGKGIGINNLNKGSLENLFIAVPPLNEQHRIVAKVDELMALCDQLEQQQTASHKGHQTLVETLLGTLTRAGDSDETREAWNRIASHFDTLFTTEHSIEQLKQAILQLAVMGKLAPQDPNDEPASMLLGRIAIEKGCLATRVVNNTQRVLPVVTDTYYELPDGWVWTRLGNVGFCNTGKTPSTRNPEYYGGEVQFIGPGQITPAGKILESDKSLTDLGCETSVIAKPGDILMVCIGGSIGKRAIASSRLAFNQQINSISPIFVSSDFLKYAMSTPQFQMAILDKATGSATPIINRSKWEGVLVPIPPVAEQYRIVAKVDELMALCDTLKARLADAQSFQIHIADAVVEQAVA